MSHQFVVAVLVLGSFVNLTAKGLELDFAGIEEPLRSVLEASLQGARAISDKSSTSRAESWGNLAMVLHAHNLYEPAISAYREALQVQSNPRWRYLKAVCQMELGRNQEAVEQLEQVVQVVSNISTIWYRLGVARTRTGQLQAADVALRRAVELDGQSAAVLVALADTLATRGRLPEALDALEGAYQIAPNAGQIVYRLAQVEMQLGNKQAGEKWLGLRINQLAPEIEDALLQEVAAYSFNPTFFISAARRAWQRGDRITALAAFEHAITLDPINQENLLDFTRLLMNMKLWDRAEEVLLDTVGLFENSAEYWFLGALLFAETSRLDEAESAIEISISLSENSRNLELRDQIRVAMLNQDN